ncbi:hypothetical protein ANANG_G00164080 [Anguilla anguilla]|uniref:Uncharacterized protein n=1 Tax=Anguilla anguilla TaxID=7936 RepID=A0A9D3RWX9_ANGAN|nr:hypothetical protein ANANG_G00164080 [Anguilla anguilla]
MDSYSQRTLREDSHSFPQSRLVSAGFAPFLFLSSLRNAGSIQSSPLPVRFYPPAWTLTLAFKSPARRRERGVKKNQKKKKEQKNEESGLMQNLSPCLCLCLCVSPRCLRHTHADTRAGALVCTRSS